MFQAKPRTTGILTLRESGLSRGPLTADIVAVRESLNAKESTLRIGTRTFRLLWIRVGPKIRRPLSVPDFPMSGHLGQGPGKTRVE